MFFSNSSEAGTRVRNFQLQVSFLWARQSCACHQRRQVVTNKTGQFNSKTSQIQDKYTIASLMHPTALLKGNI